MPARDKSRAAAAARKPAGARKVKVKAKAKASASATPATRSARSGALVLVVDDYEDAREMYAEYLAYSGFRVAEARTGVEALEKAFELLPDLILMDLSLPVMDGWEATRRLKADARMSEVIRSGIQSIPRTQFEAALAMGLTTFQAYRLVILPVALRLIVPPGTNESLNLLKNSSVALTISVAELTFQTRQIETYTARAIEALTAGTLIYLVLCLSIAAVMARVERHYAIPGLIVRVEAG